MSELVIYGELLTANAEERTISGLLLPWEEIGHTSAGSLIASKGTLTLPSDPNEIFLNLQHQKDSRVGRAVSLEEREDGLHATFRIAKTTAGNDLLEEVKEGLRAHLSIEIDQPRISNGRILAGLVTGAASVCTPAFKSAAVYSLTAADYTPENSEPKETTMDNITPETNAVSTPVQAAPIYAASTDKPDIAKATFEAVSRGGAATVNAALADLVPADDAGRVYIGEQNIGELWEARKVERKLINKVGVKNLTSKYLTGHRKNRTFAVADWAGSKAELPTGKFTTSKEIWEAKSKAVAVDVAMELIEFDGGADVIADLYSQALDSYAEQTESELLQLVSVQATEVEAGTLTPLEAINAASAQLGAIGARMDFVFVSPDVLAEIRNINSADAPWWLQGQSSSNLRGNSVTIGDVVFESSNELAPNTILVGDSRAIDYRETKDFRYKAYDVSHGGVDVSLIKFRSQKVTDTGAVLLLANVGTTLAP